MSLIGLMAEQETLVKINLTGNAVNCGFANLSSVAIFLSL